VIARLEGTLIERLAVGSGALHVVVDCNGVGYDVIVSSYTLGALPADGERVTLRIFTHANENKVALFGFIDVQERSLFDLLITVKNVGPSTAIAILSGSNPRDIATLIAKEDVPGLTRIKGVGKKTAELLVVELHEKCAELVMTWDTSGGLKIVALPAGAARGKSRRHPLVDEVAMALVGMGWRPAEADQAVADLPITPESTTEQLLRHALRSMPR
jgi:Holliday junction DNA helicase RuvA